MTRAHDGDVATDRHVEAEGVVGLSIRGEEFLHFAPVVNAALVSLEDVDGTYVHGHAIHVTRSNDRRVAADRYGPAELVIGLGVRGEELLDFVEEGRFGLGLEQIDDVRGASVCAICAGWCSSEYKEIVGIRNLREGAAASDKDSADNGIRINPVGSIRWGLNRLSFSWNGAALEI